jgi:homocysteine S-methyltransferase
MQSQSPFHHSAFYFSDGGLETTLVFEHQLELPCFAAFTLLRQQSGQQQILDYYRSYLSLESAADHGFVLETPTWRASSDWADKLGIPLAELKQLNHLSVQLMHQLVKEQPERLILISGNLGPRGDGYRVGQQMSAHDARRYHQPQINWLADAGVDLISAVTLNYADEALGIVLAAQEAKLPVVISFTVETDGLLPDGMSLPDAIAYVDKETNNGPVHYMINCAHPSHYMQLVIRGGDWIKRIGGLRSNASVLSHAELDQSTELDSGDLSEFATLHQLLKKRLPELKVLGGCCGTDCSHIDGLARQCFSKAG